MEDRSHYEKKCNRKYESVWQNSTTDNKKIIAQQPNGVPAILIPFWKTKCAMFHIQFKNCSNFICFGRSAAPLKTCSDIMPAPGKKKYIGPNKIESRVSVRG